MTLSTDGGQYALACSVAVLLVFCSGMIQGVVWQMDSNRCPFTEAEIVDWHCIFVASGWNKLSQIVTCFVLYVVVKFNSTGNQHLSWFLLIDWHPCYYWRYHAVNVLILCDRWFRWCRAVHFRLRFVARKWQRATRIGSASDSGNSAAGNTYTDWSDDCSC